MKIVTTRVAHLNLQNCEIDIPHRKESNSKEGNEFEWQSTVRVHFVRLFNGEGIIESELIFLQTFHSPLTITTETLFLSITGDKYTVAS